MADTKKVQTPIKDLGKIERWNQITRIIKDRRDELLAKILYNVELDEKKYSECDYYKLEMRIINRLLSLPNIEVETDVPLTKEEILQKEDDELEI